MNRPHVCSLLMSNKTNHSVLNYDRQILLFFLINFFSFGKPVLCNVLAIFMAPKRAGGGGGDFCLAGAAIPLPPTPLFRRL